MTQDTLNEREFELVNIIGAQISSNQRELSRHSNLSLGTTNMLLQRLIAKGYIRIRQLNKKKVEYLLTPKGFSEKMRKSVKYTLKTINSISLIRNSLRAVIQRLYDEGERTFTILGKSDFALLVEMAIKEICKDESKITHIENFIKGNGNGGGVLLICREENDPSINGYKKYINLVEELAMDYDFSRIQDE